MNVQDYQDTEEGFEVDVSPDASALKIFKNLTFTPWFALGEFVDNSITSALKNLDELKRINGPDYVLRISIDFADDGSLLVRDNAAGISRSEFSRALRTGVPPEDTSIGLSVHGAGMKAASFWWGASLEIKTWPLHSRVGWSVSIDVNNVVEKKSGISHVGPIPPRGYPGTDIRIGGLWQKVPQAKTITMIRSYLPSIYRLFMMPTSPVGAPLRLEIEFMGHVLEYEPAVLLEEPFWPTKDGPASGSQPRLWRREVDLKLSSGKHITGWVGLRAVMSRDLGGFFLHFRGKGVAGVTPLNSEDDMDRSDQSSYKPKRIFGQQGSYRDQTITGEFNISDFGKSLTTDSVTWSVSDEQEFIDEIIAILQDPDFNMWAMAENLRRGKLKKDRKQTEKDDEELSVIFDTFSQAATNLGISHEAPEESSFPENGQIPLSAFTVVDREGHEHQFSVIIVSDRSRPLLHVENGSSEASLLYINDAHPSLDSVGPVEGKVLALLTRFCLALGGAEVFSSSWDRSATRRKFNELLDIQSPRNQLGAEHQNAI